jgi:urea transport system substrate-binding protein
MHGISASRLLRAALAVGVLSMAGLGLWRASGQDAAPVRVGVLHALTGPMAASEKPVLEATLLAIEEINGQGGIAGRRIEPLVADSRAEPAHAAQEAERLIGREGVQAIFGCWTSSCRRAVKPVVEKHRNLLVYPLQYEGLERSPNILYTGLAPNQQIIPALSWAAEHLGRRVYLLGSDYLFPHAANLLVREYAAALGLQILGESYLPLGEQSVGGTVAAIVRLKPEWVINTINGDSNFAFFQALDGLAEKPKILSLSVAEVELSQAPAVMQGQYAAWSYFQTLETPENRAFAAAFRQRQGGESPIDDPMVAAYTGVKLWAQAAARAGSADPDKANHALPRQTLLSPMGIVAVDPATRHLWRGIKIGRARDDGRFDIVWSSPAPIRPMPYPLLHTAGEWTALLESAFGKER